MASFSQISELDSSATSHPVDQNLPFGSPSAARKSFAAYNGDNDGDGNDGDGEGARMRKPTREETKKMILQLSGFSARLEVVLMALLREQVRGSSW